MQAYPPDAAPQARDLLGSDAATKRLAAASAIAVLKIAFSLLPSPFEWFPTCHQRMTHSNDGPCAAVALFAIIKAIKSDR